MLRARLDWPPTFKKLRRPDALNDTCPMISESWRELIRSLKGLSGRQCESCSGVVAIRNDKGEHLGTLHLVTKAMVAEDEPVSLFDAGRQSMACFLREP